MGLPGNVEIFKELNFETIVEGQQTSLRNFQRSEFSMQGILMKDLEHSWVPDFNILRGSDHIPFVEADIGDWGSDKKFDSGHSVSWSPPLNNSLGTAESNNTVRSILPHYCVRISGDMVCNHIPGGGVVVLEFSLVVGSQ